MFANVGVFVGFLGVAYQLHLNTLGLAAASEGNWLTAREVFISYINFPFGRIWWNAAKPSYSDILVRGGRRVADLPQARAVHSAEVATVPPMRHPPMDIALEQAIAVSTDAFSGQHRQAVAVEHGGERPLADGGE